MLYLANGIGLLAITLIFAVALLSVNRDGVLISFPVSVPAALPRRPAPVPGRGDVAERDEDAVLLTALRRLIAVHRAQRQRRSNSLLPRRPRDCFASLALATTGPAFGGLNDESGQARDQAFA